MKPIIVLFAAACAADHILEAYPGTEPSRANHCATTYYSSRLCSSVPVLPLGCAALLTTRLSWSRQKTPNGSRCCFGDGPSSHRQGAYAAGQGQIYCSYSSQSPSGTTKDTTKAAVSAATTFAGASSSPASSTTSSTKTTETNSGADLALGAGSVLFIVAGAVIVLL